MPSTTIQLDATLSDARLPEMETLLDGQKQQKIAGRDDWSFSLGRFWSGVSADVEVIQLCNGPLSVFVLPTRGMGIWKADHEGTDIGWVSPVPQPVHPRFVNLQSRNGLGWLDGFNELVCRCGLASNGPPGHDEGAASPVESSLTLHGRIANLPASDIELFVDEENETIGVTGIVEEATLFGPQLRMRSTISTKIGSSTFTIRDEVTNVGAEETEFQLLYHTNLGRPFLEEGARVELPAERVVPRDTRAAEGVGSYSEFLGPTPGYTEQVYFADLIADDQNQTLAMLRNKAGNQGISVQFSREQLPCFSVWKCTQDERAGYVAGLEPATNFPNFKAFERHHGRVVGLPAGATRIAELQIAIHADEAAVAETSRRIQALQGDRSARVDSHPVAPYCPID